MFVKDGQFYIHTDCKENSLENNYVDPELLKLLLKHQVIFVKKCSTRPTRA